MLGRTQVLSDIRTGQPVKVQNLRDDRDLSYTAMGRVSEYTTHQRPIACRSVPFKHGMDRLLCFKLSSPGSPRDSDSMKNANKSPSLMEIPGVLWNSNWKIRSFPVLCSPSCWSHTRRRLESCEQM
ncbi:hypothetical protein NPIL_532731 [Nephila pilipes]|uniref:Uncharacterized protein n=1 Tax=Nephila pilipes TaxID=299642 RepID=A0A8X6MHP9_NEPPI|nr:hypothetical protein NPIL_532731 [Nephila pilipes]